MLYTSENVTKELSELSGWKPDTPEGFTTDFLMLELPPVVAWKKDGEYYYANLWLQKVFGGYDVDYWDSNTDRLTKDRLYSKSVLKTVLLEEDTPADALGILAIAMFKHGALPEEG